MHAMTAHMMLWLRSYPCISYYCFVNEPWARRRKLNWLRQLPRRMICTSPGDISMRINCIWWTIHSLIRWTHHLYGPHGAGKTFRIQNTACISWQTLHQSFDRATTTAALLTFPTEYKPMRFRLCSRISLPIFLIPPLLLLQLDQLEDLFLYTLFSDLDELFVMLYNVSPDATNPIEVLLPGATLII